MNSRSMYPAGLGVCLALLALSAEGQTTAGSSSQAANAPSNATAANTSTSAAAVTKAPASGHHKHHSAAHHQMHAKGEPMVAAPTAGSQESAYRAALKNCVAGPAEQKERCLDDAIARHGRSG
jgi:hypothetical protein